MEYDHKHLDDVLKEQKELLKNSSLYTMVKIIGEKDKYTEGHSLRVEAYATDIGKYLVKKGIITKEELKALQIAGLFHDVGKVEVLDEILQKEDSLDDYEWEEIKKHPEHGERIIKQQNYENIELIVKAIREHHERYDGRTDIWPPGYPDAKKGEEISLFGRIIHVADAFDAMRTDRVYRKKLSEKEALNELREYKGEQFDPEIIDIFINQSIYNLFPGKE